MTEEGITDKKLSRRKFMKTAAAGAIIVGAGALITPKLAANGIKSQPVTAQPSTVASTATCTPSFMTPPAPIPASSITKTFNTDIVVLGAGVAGCAAAASAVEKGARVIMLEKYHTSMAGGAWNCAFNTQDQLAAGKKTDVNAIAEMLWESSEGRADYRLIMQWLNNSGPVMDWLLGIAKKTNTPYFTQQMSPYGLDYLFGPSNMLNALSLGRTPEPCADAMEFPVIYEMLTSYGKGLGLQVYYNTRALQLIRFNNEGPVTGVIAQNSDGSYSQFNAAKAVIICTGDIANNPEMVAKYIPSFAYGLDSWYNIATNTGDGLAMALWAGANVPDVPGCAMPGCFTTNLAPLMDYRPVTAGTSLYVNKFGDRFANEFKIAESPLFGLFETDLIVRQPDHTWWQIFDSKSVNATNQAAIQAELLTGEVTTANTIGGLAVTFGADPARLTAAVNRYNQIIASGIDTDFGKPKADLGPTNDTPPYYACESPISLTVGIHGPLTNTSMQVLDTSDEVIPGLYAAGNSTSGFYGDCYPHMIFGGCRGHAITTGRLAGLNAATGSTS